MEKEALRWWGHLTINTKTKYSLEFDNNPKYWLLTDDDVIIIYQLYK